MFRTFVESALVGTLIVAICSLPACRTRSSGSAIQTSANAPSNDLPKLEDTAIWEHLDADNRSGLANMYSILQKGYDRDMFRLVDKDNTQVTLSRVLTTKLSIDDIRIVSPNAGGDVVSDVKIVTEGDTFRISFVAMNSDRSEELGSQSISIDASGNGPTVAQQAVRAIEAIKAFDAEVRYNLDSQASILDTLFPKAYAADALSIGLFCALMVFVYVILKPKVPQDGHTAIILGGSLVTLSIVAFFALVVSFVFRPSRDGNEEIDFSPMFEWD